MKKHILFFFLLLYLEAHQNSRVTQKDLEIEFKVSHPTINEIITRLENKNFITTKVIKEGGKQQKIISLDFLGNQALDNRKKTGFMMIMLLRILFFDEEKEKLLELLKRLYKILT